MAQRDETAPLRVTESESEPIAIIAGGGHAPLHLAQALEQRHAPFLVVLLEGDADAALARYDHVVLNTAQPGRLVAALRAHGIKRIVMVGSVKGRPDIGRFRPDRVTIRMMSRIAGALGQGDDALLKMVIDTMEKEGFSVVGAHEVEPDLLAPFGPLTRGAAPAHVRPAIATGVAAARALGSLDVGQGVVVIGRRVVALEGAEGTDAMLERVAHLRAAGRLSKKKAGVLVKLRKPGQDMRVDLPTIGPHTVANAAAANLSGIAIDGENTLIISRDETIATADRSGLFIIGIDPDQVAQVSGLHNDD